MDVTTLFKACVNTVKTKNRNMGLVEQKSQLLKARNRDPHLVKPKEILKHISELEQFLLKNKAAYLNVINYLSTNKTMNELDREQVDHIAESIVSSCSTLISEYKQEINTLSIKSRQLQEHYENVLHSLQTHLKDVSKIYTEAKAVRVKRVIDTHKLSKLETQPKPQDEGMQKGISKDGSGDFELRSPSQCPLPEKYENELSAEDMQMFEEENELLYNELNSISDEVKQMESKVVHISELQELFTEKVLQQEKEIERIAETVVGATENVRDANDQIRQAIQRNAGLRIGIMIN
ncbi:syntaxin-18-like isoform X2 [Anthonomus grandis grandis]|uniref:syntaxin-18-like isoform X2 n=1 Tax=Anthonomus grandis grandis TaxID=2921223 RepID=UPI00216663EE|nr:syntaxin-18-like isoform X2 [Anthonomus grandis grandis]